jgi:lipopolysaccharide export system permease protein
LLLERGQRNEVATKSQERTLSSFDSYRVLVGENAIRAVESLPVKAVDTLDLIRIPDLRAQGELTWRVGLVLAATNLLLLGIGLSATNPRRASNWNLLFALLAFVVYYNLANLSQAWVAGGRISMATALFGLHGGALALGFWLIWWRDHAAVLNWRRRMTSGIGAAT